jgi:hypothetical protein
MPAASARDRLTETCLSAARSGVDTVKSIPLLMWGMPFVLSLVIWVIARTPVGWMTEKQVQEIAAPIVIGLTAGLVLMVHKWVQTRFSLILACFVWSLFLRELHFWGTNNGFYIALVAIVIWSWVSRSQLVDFLQYISIRYFLSGAFLIYLLSKIVDRGYLAFLPEFTSWRHNLEETLETSGHVMVFCLVVMTYRIATLPKKQQHR